MAVIFRGIAVACFAFALLTSIESVVMGDDDTPEDQSTVVNCKGECTNNAAQCANQDKQNYCKNKGSTYACRCRGTPVAKDCQCTLD